MSDKQHLLYSRRNVLPVQRIDGSLVMVHEYATHALIERLEVGKTPSGPDPVLHHAPETCKGMQMVSTARWQNMQLKLLVPVRKRRRELVRPMDATALDHPDDRFPRAAKERHPLMDIVAQPLSLKMGNDFKEDFRRPILDGTQHAQQHTAGHAAPAPIAHPGLTFEGLLAFDLAPTQRAYGPARPLGFPPPAGAGQGKAPQDRFIGIEQAQLATTGAVFERREVDRRRGPVGSGRRQLPRRPAGAERIFFKTKRTRSRPSWTPVCCANTVARSRQLHWEEREPC
jgi:hypothetical protein